MSRYFAVAAAMALGWASPSTAQLPAQKGVTPQQARASNAEAMAFVRAFSPSELRREAELRILRQSFVQTLAKVSDTKAMLDAFPALGPALVEAMSSHIDLYIREYDARYFPAAAKIAQQDFSREDVLSLTAFYSTPVGRKSLALASQKIDGAEVADAAIKGEPVDGGIMDRQMTQAGWAVLGGLSAEERATFMEFVQSPLGQRFRVVQPKLGALALSIMNAPSPAFEKATQEAIISTIERITGLDTKAAK